MRKRKLALAVAVGLATTMLSATPADAKPKQPDLAKLVTVKDIRKHLQALKRISDYNGGNRQSGRAGYDISAKYIVNELKKAGFKPKTQKFPVWVFDQKGPGAFAQLAPSPAAYKPVTDFAPYELSGNGDVTAKVAAVDLDGDQGPGGSSGCEDADFAGFPKGAIALIRRGTCFFDDKVANAVKAGAGGVIIYQRTGADVPPGEVAAYGLSSPPPIPVIGTTHAIGSGLVAAAKAGTLQMRVKTDVVNTLSSTVNITAETKRGRANNVVLVGAHLDSVHAGPGINDNGSGSATLLAMAQKIHKLGKKGLRNKVRFAWWGGEEAGLLGSYYYVEKLTPAQRAKIALNLNFDMLGSPNYVRFVYDGDDSMGAGTNPPPGSGAIEKAFVKYFAKRGLKTDPTEFDGRSDYGPFIEVGIPAGGLFSGAEVIKTPRQARIYGGKAGKAFDVCYHAACDNLRNINWNGLSQLSDGAAAVTQRYAYSTLEVNGVRSYKQGPAAATNWKGGRLVR